MTNNFKTSALLSLVAASVLNFGIPAQAVAAGANVNRNTNVNRNVNANTNVNRNVNANTNVNRNVNANVNVNRNVNVNVDNRYGNNYNNNYHPVATAAVVGAAVAVTAAAVGSIVAANQLPTNCVQVNRGGVVYMQCGSAWYQPQYQGSNVTYIVVNPL